MGREDKYEPNLLEKKLQHLIQSSAIFIALITEPALQSEWVIWETNYAHSISKPLILLKDKNVNFPSSYEWIEFDRNDSTSLLDIVMLAISKTNYKPENKSDILDFLSIALLSFLAGWYLRK